MLNTGLSILLILPVTTWEDAQCHLSTVGSRIGQTEQRINSVAIVDEHHDEVNSFHLPLRGRFRLFSIWLARLLVSLVGLCLVSWNSSVVVYVCIQFKVLRILHRNYTDENDPPTCAIEEADDLTLQDTEVPSVPGGLFEKQNDVHKDLHAICRTPRYMLWPVCS